MHIHRAILGTALLGALGSVAADFQGVRVTHSRVASAARGPWGMRSAAKVPSASLSFAQRARGGNVAPGTVASSSGLLGPLLSLELGPLKVVLMSMLTLLNVACWALPLRSKALASNDRLLSLASCFSGGIFFALSLGHLIPEAIESMLGSGAGPELALWCALLGYVLVFFVDKVAFDTHGALERGEANKMGAVVLLCALCVHSSFETLALGVSKTRSSASLLAASIGLHQPAESLALLVALLKSNLPRSTVVRLLTIFTLVAPLGCAMGMWAQRLDMPMLDAALASVAAGTFIYVGANEVVAEEFEHCHGGARERWEKFIAFLGGIACVGGISSVSAGWHGH